MFDHTLFDKKDNKKYKPGCSSILLIIILIVIIVLSGCTNARAVSDTMAREEETFNIYNRIIFYNDTTSNYFLQIEGFCYVDEKDSNEEVSIVCRVGQEEYKKHRIGLSENVTYIVEQIDPQVSEQYRYFVIFEPVVIFQNIELKGDNYANLNN